MRLRGSDTCQLRQCAIRPRLRILGPVRKLYDPGLQGQWRGAGDILEFDSAIFSSFAEVLAATTDLGRDILITHADGTILLRGVNDLSHSTRATSRSSDGEQVRPLGEGQRATFAKGNS